jgi:hypothetical protein
LTTGTTYRIEPRVIFDAPEYSATQITVPTNTTWTDIAYSDTTETYTNLTGGPGTGTVVGDDGLVPEDAIFNVTKTGRNYTISIVDGGAGYEFGQELIIPGDELGGAGRGGAPEGTPSLSQSCLAYATYADVC